MFELYHTTEKQKLTYSDYAVVEDGFRYELINGELLMAPAPSTFHQESHYYLMIILSDFIRRNNLGRIYYAPTDVILDEFNTVQPDILFISKENLSKIKRNAIYGAPDFVVEIISPYSIHRDRYLKKELYELHGVKEFWLLDIENKSVEVFNNNNGHFDLYSLTVEKGKIESNLFPDLEIMIEDILPDFDLIS